MVSLIQWAARIRAQSELISGGIGLSWLYLSLSLTCISVLLEILVTSSCGSHSVYPCSSLTLKRKVRVQRPWLAIAPTFKLSSNSRHSGEYLEFQGLWRVPQIPGNSHLHCAALAAASVPINLSVELTVFQSVETRYLNSIKARHNIVTPWNLWPHRWDLLLSVLCLFKKL